MRNPGTDENLYIMNIKKFNIILYLLENKLLLKNKRL